MAGKKITEEVHIPEGVEVRYEDREIKVKGPQGETSKPIYNPKITISVSDDKVTIYTAENATKREKAKVGSMRTHIQNMCTGVKEGFTYELKICSGHFPMDVSVSNNQLLIKNFLGEKTPRVVDLKEGATVTVDGQQVLVKSVNKEIAGQVAADIEQACRITNRDKRIFQDGIYIVNKGGKAIVQ